ncbi:MAG: hypothetical protein OQJ97_15075 [Rhodospirillales bacterium]|nr:hypothetical protein [Rhodospirillales bacterium]
MSVFISILLGCCLVLLVLPTETTNKDENRKQPTKTAAPKSLDKKLAQATPSSIILPAPPPPPMPVAKAVPPKPKMQPEEKQVAKVIPKPITKPKSQPVKQVVRKPVPRKAIAPKPRPAQPNPKPEPTVSLASAGKKGLQEGRALLRVLEHGAGPMIEIAWPGSATQRDILYKRFSQCFGMRIALVDEQVGLFVDEGQPGRKWEINMDRFSGFLRQPSGGLARNERSKVQRIRHYHGGLNQASPIRLFPRNVDALLLSGLGEIVGSAYKNAKNIRATYRIEGQHTLVGGISVDGRPLPGTIDLSGAGRGCSRRV